MIPTLTFTKPQTHWIVANQIDEQRFYDDEKERFINEDCKHRIKNGQCILRKLHAGEHIISFNKNILSVLISGNIFIKMLSSNWRVW